MSEDPKRRNRVLADFQEILSDFDKSEAENVRLREQVALQVKALEDTRRMLDAWGNSLTYSPGGPGQMQGYWFKRGGRALAAPELHHLFALASSAVQYALERAQSGLVDAAKNKDD
jgi:hypothetical protein